MDEIASVLLQYNNLCHLLFPVKAYCIMHEIIESDMVGGLFTKNNVFEKSFF